MEDRQQEGLLGTVCLWNFNEAGTIADIGYELHPDHTGKGWMTHALQTILPLAFQHSPLHKIIAYTHQDNLASIRLAERFGFQKLVDQPADLEEDMILLEITRAAFYQLLTGEVLESRSELEVQLVND